MQNSQLALSNTEERIVSLLGQGIQPEEVANALGITPARISQLLSDEAFASRVTELRYQNLQKHNMRDNAYDELEDELVKKLKKNLALIFKPEVLLKAIATINGAKRRGQSAPDQIVNQQNIVSLTLPVQITQKFVTNINNQVIKAGEQDLITITSGNLLNKVEQALNDKEEIEHDSSVKTSSRELEVIVGDDNLKL